MPRRKTPTAYIEDGRQRRRTFKKKRRGLLRKAGHLAALCAVPVAVVVCADPKTGGAAPTVMQTEERVFDRYRALLADNRGEHTHIGYLEDALKKEKTRLARLRKAVPGGLELPHAEMGIMSLGELRGLFVSVEAALAAAVERRRALGLPVDQVVAPRRDTGAWTVGGSPSDGGFLHMMQQGQGEGGVDIDHGLLDQPMIGQGDGGAGINHGLLDQPMIGQGDRGAGINHGLLDQPMIGQGDGGDGINHGPLDQPMIGQGDGGAGINHGPLDQPMIGQGDGGAGINHGLLDQPMIGQGDGSGMIPFPLGLYNDINMPGAMFPLGLYDGINMPGAVHLGGYQVPMTGYAPPGPCFQPYDANTQPWNFQYDGEGTGNSWMVAPSPSNGDYNHGAVHDLAIARYPYMHTSGNPLAAENPGRQFTGNYFTGTLTEFLDVGASGNGGSQPAAENPDQFTGSNFSNLGASGNGMKYQNAAYDSMLFANSSHHI